MQLFKVKMPTVHDIKSNNGLQKLAMLCNLSKIRSAARSLSQYLFDALREPVSFGRLLERAASFSRTYLGRAIDARLHTAVSSAEVYSTISVQRLLHLIVPKFCWFDFLLQESL